LYVLLFEFRFDRFENNVIEILADGPRIVCRRLQQSIKLKDLLIKIIRLN